MDFGIRMEREGRQMDDLMVGGLRFKGTTKELDEESEIDEEELENIEETVLERLVGLSEMVPDRWWNFGRRSALFSFWLMKRSAWVIGTSLAVLWFPAFIENQRLEMVAMQDMQTKQLLLGPGQNPLPGGPRPM